MTGLSSSNKRRIIFLHVGKSGGATSARQVRAVCMHRRGMFQKTRVRVLAKWNRNVASNYQIISWQRPKSSSNWQWYVYFVFSCLAQPRCSVQVYLCHDEHTDLRARGQEICSFITLLLWLRNFEFSKHSNHRQQSKLHRLYKRHYSGNFASNHTQSHVLQLALLCQELNVKFKDKAVFVVRVEKNIPGLARS